ncbi:unnamed protein product [Symbiodinium sp. CCMP2456]|nr:unnamed protein product [Symbiodinium sp. CCMP2456]
MHHRGPVLTAAGLSVFVGLCCTLWYFVWRPPGESDTEKGYRTAEMMEQGLLLLSYVQLLTGVQATQSYTAQSQRSPWSEIWQLRAEFAMQLLSVQCLAGHQRGREIEILASIYSLPVLWVLGLAVATCRGSPFLALKFGIVATSMLFIGVIKVIFPNLSWCVRKAGGKELGKLAFFHERPFQKCTDSDDPLALHLLLGLSINAALIPVGLLLTGWYIARRMRSVDSLAGCIRPGRLARCGADSVELILWEGVPTDVAASIDLGKYEHLPKAALCVYAAAHTAHLAELMCASSVAKTEAGLTIRVPFSETWAMLELKYQQHCMAVTRMDADMLGS